MTHQNKLYLYTMLSKYVSTPLGSMLINSYSLFGSNCMILKVSVAVLPQVSIMQFKL